MGAETESQEKFTQERPKTTITQEQFLSWKRQKTQHQEYECIEILFGEPGHPLTGAKDIHDEDAAVSASLAEVSRKRAEDIAAGTVQMNGRELFAHEPWVAVVGTSTPRSEIGAQRTVEGTCGVEQRKTTIQQNSGQCLGPKIIYRNILAPTVGPRFEESQWSPQGAWTTLTKWR
ncbi:hypothetical protein V8G54_036503 [Vigna mungo]|uniref:ZC3H15/TMA46 family C-terminal domain-containing protein n=1 Tax=Vigna mungo TaxID=3915 RepID=A0AAQ3MIK2_VIGMU